MQSLIVNVRANMEGKNMVLTDLTELDRIIRNAVREEIERFKDDDQVVRTREPEVYTAKDIQKIFKISSVTLWRWENDGILKPTRVRGKKKYYDAGTVQQLIDGGKVGKYVRQ